MTYNRITLRGYAGDAPQIKYLDSSTCIASFQLATHSDGYVTDEGRIVVSEVTEWHSVLCFYNNAQIAEENVQKGLLIEVEGRLSYRITYSKEGQRRKIAFVLADSIRVLTKEVRPNEQEKEIENPNNPYGTYLNALEQDAEENLPF